MCNVLNEIYCSIFNEHFIFDNINQRIKLQKAIYMLENLGVHVGDYSFTWSEDGPYSIALEDDAYRCSQQTERHEVIFTKEAQDAFNLIKEMLSKKKTYQDYRWLECISSLHYLKYVMHASNDDNVVIERLIDKNKYLNNWEENKIAMDMANILEVGCN